MNSSCPMCNLFSTGVWRTGSWKDAATRYVATVMLCYLRAIPGHMCQATCSVALVLNLGRSSLSDPLQVWPSVKLTCFFPGDLEKSSSKELGLRAANASPIIFGKPQTLGKALGPLHGM